MSIYDGETEYVLGKTMHAKRGGGGWAPLECCFFVHRTPLQALEAALPVKSKQGGAPRVLIRVTAEGRGYEMSGGTNKLAFPVIHVRQLLTDAFVYGAGAGPNLLLHFRKLQNAGPASNRLQALERAPLTLRNNNTKNDDDRKVRRPVSAK